MSSAFFYTKGKGYYESYENKDSYSNYGLQEVIIGGDTITKTNLVNQKWLDNDFYGLNLAFNYDQKNIKASFGGGWNQYDGDHYGYIIWAEHSSNSFIDKPWYENTGKKSDFNIFGKINYQLSKPVSLYADLQYRGISYKIMGNRDDLQYLTQTHNFNFFNPKGGVYFTIDQNNAVYGSVALANREPSRTVYRDADPGQKISAEKLTDYEAGYKYHHEFLNLEANFYYMDYKNQLVLTGQINNVGDPILVNVPKSYRTGIELNGGLKIFKNLRWDLNLTLSQNKILNFVAYTDNWDLWPEQNVDTIGTTDISFSPDIIGGSILSWEPLKSFRVSLQSKYVGRQYIDNSSNKERSLDPYFVNDLKFYYTFNPGIFKELSLMLSLNNILNTEYSSNAWVYPYYSGGTEYEDNGYFPQAKFNFMAGLSLKF